MAVETVAARGVSIALACRTFQISECCYRYDRKLSDENAEIEDWLVKLTDNRRTWGFGLFFLHLWMLNRCRYQLLRSCSQKTCQPV
jgi:putative transposase